MKYLVFLFMAASFSISAASAQNTKGGNEPKLTESLQGTYESKKGVMHTISCYGHNIGFLTIDTGEKVVICFDQLPDGSDIKVDCETLAVSGYYAEKSITSEGGPCTSGTKKIFYVEKWNCK